MITGQLSGLSSLWQSCQIRSQGQSNTLASMKRRKRLQSQDPDTRVGKTVQEGDTVILTVGDKQMFAKATKLR